MTVATTSAKSLSGLICACKNPDGSICDPNGYNVTIKAQNWAGTAHVRANRTNIFEQPRRTVITNLTAYESELKSTAADIQVQSCTTNGFYCAQTVQVDWNLRSVNPCVVGERRAGILCTVCKPGYTLHSLDFYVSTGASCVLGNLVKASHASLIYFVRVHSNLETLLS